MFLIKVHKEIAPWSGRVAAERHFQGVLSKVHKEILLWSGRVAAEGTHRRLLATDSRYEAILTSGDQQEVV